MIESVSLQYKHSPCCINTSMRKTVSWIHTNIEPLPGWRVLERGMKLWRAPRSSPYDVSEQKEEGGGR